MGFLSDLLQALPKKRVDFNFQNDLDEDTSFSWTPYHFHKDDSFRQVASDIFSVDNKLLMEKTDKKDRLPQGYWKYE